jgi:hypothetical protein
MRWGATGVVEAARAERLVDDAEAAHLQAVARHRVELPSFVPGTPADLADDVRLATLAVTVALRRHARPGSPTSAGRDLRRVRALVGSGGVLRHADATSRAAVLRPGTTDHGGGWRVPEDPVVVVDTDYVLFAAGLLAGAGADGAAARLATGALLPAGTPAR